jgi:hypothetical protein
MPSAEPAVLAIAVLVAFAMVAGFIHSRWRRRKDSNIALVPWYFGGPPEIRPEQEPPRKRERKHR